MKNDILFKKIISMVFIVLFIFGCFNPTISGYKKEKNSKMIPDLNIDIQNQEELDVKFYSIGLDKSTITDIQMTQFQIDELFDKIEQYAKLSSDTTKSYEAQLLKEEIIQTAQVESLIPNKMYDEILGYNINPILGSKKSRILTNPDTLMRGSAFFCNFVTTGQGSQFPILILPRLIPIVLLPIPRIFLSWSAIDAITSCGGMLTGRGFIATGPQTGMALGFWGIGFSVFLPPIMSYGFIGYALYATANAEIIEPWPPNYPPMVYAEYPPNEGYNIPVSTDELRFSIFDENRDLMDYSVTTDPHIGAGMGEQLPDGTYSITVGGLEGTEDYSWTVYVSDGNKSSLETFTFSTEPTAPIVLDPNPEDGEKYVPVSTSTLSFKLSDPQNDLMDYTVETVPDIGAGSGIGVPGGTYTVDISDLDYSSEYLWFVNVTDGENWKHKVFSFNTEHMMTFDPFSSGWGYRKKITVDHSLVDGDIVNFPVLISTVDVDLRDKAQDDGDDILFMDGAGVANRLFHEIEEYTGGSGSLIAWVNIPFLNSSVDTDFYMYYGNPVCDDQQAAELVWDSGFESVWHMNDETVNTISDSTFNYNTGYKILKNNPIEVSSGKIGKAQDFERDNEAFIDARGTYEVGLYDDTTFSGWVKIESHSTNIWNVIMSTMEGASAKYVVMRLFKTEDPNYPKKGGFWSSDGNPPVHEAFSNDPLNTDTWYYICGVLDRVEGYQYLYINGVQQIDYINIEDLGSCADGTDMFFIGADDPDNNYLGFWDGILDELRVSNIPRTPSWISTEFNNQNNPSSFTDFGPEET